MLRPPQVRLVRELAGAALAGTSVCQQMLMGEGKTTVISPLLALLLGESNLVMQIVPAQLLAFALSVLRSVFGAGQPLRKPVWTFAFDRRTPVSEALLDKARVARAERAVMVTTPASVKACMTAKGTSTDQRWLKKRPVSVRRCSSKLLWLGEAAP